MIEGKWYTGDTGLERALSVRRAVFGETGAADSHDPISHHLIITENSVPIASGRMYPDGDCMVLGCIALIPEKRGQGIGDLAARMLLFKGINMGAKRFRIYACDRTAGFYKRFGFKETSEHSFSGLLMTLEAQDCIFPKKCASERGSQDG